MPLSLNLDLNILGVLGYLLASTTLKGDEWAVVKEMWAVVKEFL